MQQDYSFSIPGVDIPPDPDPQTAQRLSFLHFLERSQWWSEDTLKRYQFRELSKLVQFSCSHSPFYADQLAGIPTTEKELLQHVRNKILEAAAVGPNMVHNDLFVVHHIEDEGGDDPRIYDEAYNKPRSGAKVQDRLGNSEMILVNDATACDDNNTKGVSGLVLGFV